MIANSCTPNVLIHHEQCYTQVNYKCTADTAGLCNLVQIFLRYRETKDMEKEGLVRVKYIER
jgi:hypothetical protein